MRSSEPNWGPKTAREGRRFLDALIELSPPWAVRSAAAVCAALLLGQDASAQVSGSWLGQSGPYPRLWSDGSLWTSNPLYPGGGGVATFGPETSGSLQLDRSVTLSTIAIDNAVAADGIAVYAVGSNRVTLTGIATLDAGPYSATSLAYGGPVLRFPLVSTAGFVKTGPGALNVDFGDPSVAGGAAQPLQGDVRVNAGTLLVTPTSAYPLGNPANRILLDGGGRVGLSACATSWTLAHPVVVGAGGGGISNPGGGTLTVASTVSGGGLFVIDRDEIQAPPGRVVFTAGNPLTGALTHESQDVLALTGAGAFTAIPSLTLYSRAELDYAAGVVNRLRDTSPVTLAGRGALTLVAPASAPAEERAGPLRLAGGEVAVAFTTSSTSEGGSDRITMGGGNVTVLGGDGDDALFVNVGNDVRFTGGAGRDTLLAAGPVEDIFLDSDAQEDAYSRLH
jgi:hypothetical protein